MQCSSEITQSYYSNESLHIFFSWSLKWIGDGLENYGLFVIILNILLIISFIIHNDIEKLL